MNKYKICVYAICKNEEKFVERWVKSMSEADEIYVLDTGSTDNTVSKLKKLGVNVVSKKINPWRFDSARNESLKLVPNDYDICVCTDLDEVFKPGWRKKLEEVWDKDTTCLHYDYNWLLDENGIPKVNFYIGKIHKRNDYEWVYPVHEVLKYNGENEKVKFTDEITLNHYPDSTKSRGQYLPLLELSVKENPNDDRNLHYLGREYMYYGKWNESIDTLIKHLRLPSATWKDERCASMRFISRCYKNMERYDEAEMWLKKAINEAPHLRDPHVEMALLKYELQKWNELIYYANEALKIESHPKTYINEIFSYDNTLYDLLSLAYYNISDYAKSYENINTALSFNPNDERLINNQKIIRKLL